MSGGREIQYAATDGWHVTDFRELVLFANADLRYTLASCSALSLRSGDQC